MADDRRTPGSLEALIEELRRVAEGDARGMVREVSMRRDQFVDEHDLRKWADLMDRAADELATVLRGDAPDDGRALREQIAQLQQENVRGDEIIARGTQQLNEALARAKAAEAALREYGQHKPECNHITEWKRLGCEGLPPGNFIPKGGCTCGFAGAAPRDGETTRACTVCGQPILLRTDAAPSDK